MSNRLLDFLKNKDNELAIKKDLSPGQKSDSCNAANNIYFLGYLNTEMQYMAHFNESHYKDIQSEIKPGFFKQGQEEREYCIKCNLTFNNSGQKINNSGIYLGELVDFSENQPNILAQADQGWELKVEENVLKLMTPENITSPFFVTTPMGAQITENSGFINQANLKGINISKSNFTSGIKTKTFQGCDNLRVIVFQGTKIEWKSLLKEDGWIELSDNEENEPFELTLDGNETISVNKGSYLVICIDANTDKITDYFIEFINELDKEYYLVEHKYDDSTKEHQFILDLSTNNVNIDDSLILCYCKFNADYNLNDTVSFNTENPKLSYTKTDPYIYSKNKIKLSDLGFKKDVVGFFIYDGKENRFYFLPPYPFYL